ncbi:type II toxin-antitoxin system VapC family toxin [Saccharopolyspora sp. ID03-671]|uniref:type II toxin-antitoxin system VapC family toxin n=1 Tax=Saccharopolyspora sp. ID03-671 TaxID=3073066 RepID=UPI003244BD37
MIVLDTNVISELTRHTPDPGVQAWLDSQPATEIATTAITAAELLYGVRRLPAGDRKTVLATKINTLVNDLFAGRIEPFDSFAATQYAAVVGDRDKLGRPIAVADAQIAAICRARQASLATRNIKDFEETGVELVNPWSPQ